jgi:hypothetical protein
VPSKTLNDQVRELAELASTLNAQVRLGDGTFVRIEAAQEKSNDALHKLDKDLAALVEQVKALEKKLSERRRARRSSLLAILLVLLALALGWQANALWPTLKERFLPKPSQGTVQPTSK